MYVKPQDYLTFKGSNEGQKFILYLLGLDVNLMKEIHKFRYTNDPYCACNLKY